jgi:hypothetical protein
MLGVLQEKHFLLKYALVVKCDFTFRSSSTVNSSEIDVAGGYGQSVGGDTEGYSELYRRLLGCSCHSEWNFKVLLRRPSTRLLWDKILRQLGVHIFLHLQSRLHFQLRVFVNETD